MMRLASPSGYAESFALEAQGLTALFFVSLGFAVVVGLNRLFVSINSAGADKVSQDE